MAHIKLHRQVNRRVSSRGRDAARDTLEQALSSAVRKRECTRIAKRPASTLIPRVYTPAERCYARYVGQCKGRSLGKLSIVSATRRLGVTHMRARASTRDGKRENGKEYSKKYIVQLSQKSSARITIRKATVRLTTEKKDMSFILFSILILKLLMSQSLSSSDINHNLH